MLYDTWDMAGAQMDEMIKAGWEVTLLNWQQKEGWTCDVQKGDNIDDPNVCESHVYGPVAVRMAYKEWLKIC